MTSALFDAIDAEIDAAKEDLFALCRYLVEADSTNPPGRTAEMAAVAAAWLKDHGASVEVVQQDDEAPNVISRVEGARAGPHVVFNAHMDTMESGDPALWTTPPLSL